MDALQSKGELEIKESIERFMDVEQKNPQPQNCGPKLHNSQLPMKNVFYGKLIMWFLVQTRLLGKLVLRGLSPSLKLAELSSFVTILPKLALNLF